MSEKAELGSQIDGLGIWVQVKNWLQIYCNQIQGGLERKRKILHTDRPSGSVEKEVARGKKTYWFMEVLDDLTGLLGSGRRKIGNKEV